jgi:hypothetical protein
VYMALLAVIYGFASAAYWRCADNSKRLQQNAAEILQAVEVGELWRGDVRLAQTATTNGELLTLAQSDDTVEYRFDKDCVWRHSARLQRTVCVLRNVSASRMGEERRTTASAWKWELELQSPKKPPFLRPLFTFEAVPVK